MPKKEKKRTKIQRPRHKFPYKRNRRRSVHTKIPVASLNAAAMQSLLRPVSPLYTVVCARANDILCSLPSPPNSVHTLHFHAWHKQRHNSLLLFSLSSIGLWCAVGIYTRREAGCRYGISFSLMRSRGLERGLCVLYVCVCVRKGRGRSRAFASYYSRLSGARTRAAFVSLGGSTRPRVLHASSKDQPVRGRGERESSCKALNCNFLDPLIAQEREA